jgi:hypothetical protein
MPVRFVVRLSVMCRQLSRNRPNTPSTGFEFTWACGPPIDMKIGLSLCGMLKGRGRHRSDFTLDKVRPFLSLIGNARFEPIYVAPSLRVGRVVARDGV